MVFVLLEFFKFILKKEYICLLWALKSRFWWFNYSDHMWNELALWFFLYLYFHFTSVVLATVSAAGCAYVYCLQLGDKFHKSLHCLIQETTNLSKTKRKKKKKTTQSPGYSAKMRADCMAQLDLLCCTLEMGKMRLLFNWSAQHSMLIRSCSASKELEVF